MPRVLIADDFLVLREVYRLFLEPYFRCETAADGREAADKYAASLEAGDPYDLVLLDLVMPVMNGQDAARSIRECEDRRGLGERVAIIVTTSDYSLEKYRMDLEGCGISALLKKPVSKDHLWEHIARSFGQQ